MLRKGPLFEANEREHEFLSICKNLKCFSESKWNMFHTKEAQRMEITNEYSDEVFEFSVSELELKADSSSKVNHSSVTEEKSYEKKNYNQDNVPIVTETAYRLKELLRNIQDGYLLEQQSVELSILSTMPSCHVSALCEKLGLSTLNDVAMATFLTGILQLEKQVSLATASILVHHAVYPKVIQYKMKQTKKIGRVSIHKHYKKITATGKYIIIEILTNNTSRTLVTAILSFTETYPKAISDEVVIPCLKKQSLDAAQLELIVKIIKSYLPNEQILSCIKSIVEWESPVFSTMQCLLERKAVLGEAIHDQLGWKLLKWNAEFSSDLKFTKMLITILTFYGGQLNEKQLALYNDIVKSNQTILKRAADNLLKKLQQPE